MSPRSAWNLPSPAEALSRSDTRRWLLFAVIMLGATLQFAEQASRLFGWSGRLGLPVATESLQIVFAAVLAGAVLLLLLGDRRNPWAYVLTAVTALYASERVYIYVARFLGTSDEGGIIGLGGALGLIPLQRAELHAGYTGLTLGVLVLYATFVLDRTSATDTVATAESTGERSLHAHLVPNTADPE